MHQPRSLAVPAHRRTDAPAHRHTDARTTYASTAAHTATSTPLTLHQTLWHRLHHHHDYQLTPYTPPTRLHRYSIYECVVHDTFADGLGTPSGLALDASSELLYVADWATGDVAVFDTSSKQKLRVFTTVSGAGGVGSGRGLSGIAFAPNSGGLYGVNGELNPVSSRI